MLQFPGKLRFVLLPGLAGNKNSDPVQIQLFGKVQGELGHPRVVFDSRAGAEQKPGINKKTAVCFMGSPCQRDTFVVTLFLLNRILDNVFIRVCQSKKPKIASHALVTYRGSALRA